MLRQPDVIAGEVVPLGPNLVAVCVCFAFLMAAPWICLEIQAKFFEDAIDEDPVVEDPVVTMFHATSVEESLVIAVVGSLLLLVIGVILQAWQSHRPFPSRWPLIFACPIAWVLLVPDALFYAGARRSPASSSVRWPPWRSASTG